MTRDLLQTFVVIATSITGNSSRGSGFSRKQHRYRLFPSARFNTEEANLPIYKGKNLRKGRYSESGRPYLITTVTHNRLPLFADFTAGRLLAKELQAMLADGIGDSLAWVIMPDHLHWLVIPRQASLAQIIQRVKARSALAINRCNRTSGVVWQKGYHDHALRSDEDMVAVARYIIANPIRAGICKSVGEYPLWDATWL
jgi:putative transposase